MGVNNIIKKIVIAVMISAIVMISDYQPVMAAEKKLSKKDFVAKMNDGNETYDLFDHLNDIGEAVILFVYDKNYDNSKEGVVKTSRGICIGLKETSVIKKYGKGTNGKLSNDIVYNRMIDNKDEDFKAYFKDVNYVISYKYTDKSLQGDTYNSRIHFYFDKNKKVVAVAFSRILGKSISDYLYYYNKGNSYYESGNYQDAIEYYIQAMKRNEEDPEIYNSLGVCYDLLGEYEDAINYYTVAIQLDPEDAFYQANMGYALYRLKKYEEAIVYLDKSIQIIPKNTQPYITKGDALYFLYRYDEAIECYDKAINLPFGDTAYVYYSKGSALYGLGKYEEAIKAFDIAIGKVPDYIGAYDNKGNALNRLGKYEEACKMFDKVLEMQPEDVDAYNGKGDSYYFQGKYKESIDYYDKAISLDPTNLLLYSNKANALLQLGNYADCLIICDKMIGIDSDYADSYYIKSRVYAIQKKESDSLANLKKAVELNKIYILFAKGEAAFDIFRNSEEFMKIISDSYK